MSLVTIGRPGGVRALFADFSGGFFTNVQSQFVQYQADGVNTRLDGDFTTFSGNVVSGVFWKITGFPEPADGSQTTWQGIMSWELYNADREAALMQAMTGDDIIRVQVLATDINALLEGFNGDDRLDATEGQNDTLKGGSGDDTLIGGDGKDMLTGGKGGDIFVFRNASDSAVGAQADRITDFGVNVGGEVIDLSALRGPKLHFIGTHAFTPFVGEVRVKDVAGPDVVIQIDLDHDKAPEMEIRLSHVNAHALHAGDFVL